MGGLMATKEEILIVLKNIHEKKNSSLTKIAEEVGYDFEKQVKLLSI